MSSPEHAAPEEVAAESNSMVSRLGRYVSRLFRGTTPEFTQDELLICSSPARLAELEKEADESERLTGAQWHQKYVTNVLNEWLNREKPTGGTGPSQTP